MGRSMADLTGWTGPLDLGPFRIGLRHRREIDLAALTDDELKERMRELFQSLVNSWRAGKDRQEAYLLVQGLRVCPDLRRLLSEQEAHDLGI